jgi:hypothetical protein
MPAAQSSPLERGEERGRRALSSEALCTTASESPRVYAVPLDEGCPQQVVKNTQGAYIGHIQYPRDLGQMHVSRPHDWQQGVVVPARHDWPCRVSHD